VNSKQQCPVALDNQRVRRELLVRLSHNLSIIEENNLLGKWIILSFSDIITATGFSTGA
jgi:hypothetical protein